MNKKIQRICQWGLLLSFISGMLTPSIVVATTTDFRIQVQPLECSVDTLSSGINTLTQVSPNCATLEKLPILDYRAIGDNSVSEKREGRVAGMSSSERFFYAPFPTGYDSAYPAQAFQNDNHNSLQHYTDTLVPVIVVALVAASIIILVTQGSLSGVSIRQWLRRFRARS